MNKIIVLGVIITFFSCQPKQEIRMDNKDSEKEINLLLNQWHKDVATYNYDAYFNKMTDNAVFVGTDASEVWSKEEFQNFCKPFFEKKSTWNFKPIKRNVYFDASKEIAWFDETLATWMGICRGSGVVSRKENDWKIEHYVLSIVVPNEDVKKVVAIKKERDSLYLQTR